MIEINERLRELRVKCGFTQNQLAKILNIDRSTYAYYETGKTRPDVSTIMTLAKIFNISVSELLEDEFLPQSVAERKDTRDYVHGKKNSSHIYELSMHEKELVGAFRVCSAEQQEKILAYVHRTVEKNTDVRHVH
ncbi:MAG: helix-turn-helix domain-containing protein [Oscillospiraceae bacterium]|nr:helix-turn-helix domain-containing protein [Oscillospiraceae bacterium]MCI1990451.1 helix-turn-helix domain-containing protein [Oscillospiraceae bacterium]MCI2035789.1 helix-turn-helix domain-containing protein [Oscillospiraceae bacterium]